MRGDWMQTYTGRRFYPGDPKPDDIVPEDIAHALSLLCRYAGHIDRFFSVGQHCLLMSHAVSPKNALAALLHDATEAYVVDVPRPLKLMLPDYQRIEQRVWEAICERFDLDLELPREVEDADRRILIDETKALMPNREHWPVDDDSDPLGVKIVDWTPLAIEGMYLNRLNFLLETQSQYAAKGSRAAETET